MKDHTSRVVIILLVAALGLYFMWPPNERLKRGIDLKGGTILVYQVDKATAGGSFDMDRMVAALSKRINPGGTLDVTIRPMGGDRIEIILPEADPQQVEAIQKRVTQMGHLEFRILAHAQRDRSAIQDALDRRRRNEPPPPKYEWVKLDRPEEFSPDSGFAIDEDYILTKLPDEPVRVTGDDLTRAEPTTDDQLQTVVGFYLNSRGTVKFGRLTRMHKPEPDGFRYNLAILLDNRVMSAPEIKEPIEGGAGNITMGRLDPDERIREVDNLVAVLNAGKLPAMLLPDPISKDTVTATLGEDTIRMGRNAILVSMIAVPLLMLLYYRFSGLVANLALVLNLVIILGFMGFTGSTFTLPGLAGLALTVGMAVDANVLIFERMREEVERGSSLNQSVRNGFDRAWLAILDSNLTTIITGAILWWLGTDQIKGFAVTLVAGLAANLFTAVFVSRVIFEIWLKRGWLTRLSMLHLIKTPSLDYVSPRYYFITGSAIVVAIGVAITAARGSNLLDIDFTGGTAISVRLTDPSLGVDFVRAEAEKIENDQGDRVLPNVKVERLIPEGASKEESLFLLRTTNKNQAEVRQAIIKQFHDQLKVLATVHIKDTKTEPIAASAAASSEPAKADGPEKAADDDSAFAGGHRVTITLSQAINRDTLVERINAVLKDQQVAEPERQYSLEVGEPGPLTNTFGSFILETKLDPEKVLPQVNRLLEQSPIFERENNFDSQVAGETKVRAVYAMMLSWVAMIIYLWFRFKNVSFGLAAVVALVHDVLVALSFVALGGWFAQALPGVAGWLLIDDFKVDLTMVTAFMTIIGFSVNDTIVIFDRLREIRGKSPYITSDMINATVNQCMSRTLLTSLTVVVVVAIMYVFGGPGIHGFSFGMLIGCISGTYSTVFIAAPILILFEGGGAAPAPAPARSFEVRGAAARA